MSIMDYFRPTPASSAPTTQQGAPQKQTTQGFVEQKTAKPNEPLNNNQQAFAAAGTEGASLDGSPKNPLDSFAGMYHTDPKNQPEKPPAFNLDPKLLETAASGLKFSSHVTPELAQKL